MTPKDELLNDGAREYTAFQETLRGLSETQMSEVWLGTWSVKDIVAHISGWHREMGPALERLARGEKPIADGVSYDDVDGWNARFAAAAWPACCASSTRHTNTSCGPPTGCRPSAGSPARPRGRSSTATRPTTTASTPNRSGPGGPDAGSDGVAFEPLTGER